MYETSDEEGRETINFVLISTAFLSYRDFLLPFVSANGSSQIKEG